MGPREQQKLAKENPSKNNLTLAFQPQASSDVQTGRKLPPSAEDQHIPARRHTTVRLSPHIRRDAAWYTNSSTHWINWPKYLTQENV